MRGKVSHCIRNVTLFRITPAYAGKSNNLPSCSVSLWDHPRICGEKYAAITQTVSYLGSPPHMRGKVTVHGVDKMLDRITPAYAGKRLAVNLQRVSV